MEIFKASVQYNDVKGSSAADRADMTDAGTWPRKCGYISSELVVGISMWAGENHGAHADPVSVKFLVSDLNGYESVSELLRATGDPIRLKEIDVDMNIYEFLAPFRR